MFRRIIFFCTLLSTLPLLGKDNCTDRLPDSIVLEPNYVEFFFLKQLPGFFPFPTSTCLNSGDVVTFKDMWGKSFGATRADEVQTITLNELFSIDKKDSPVFRFLESLDKIGIDRVAFLRIHWWLYFKKDFEGTQEIKLAHFNFNKPESGYFQPWGAGERGSKHFSAQTIKYQKLLQLMSEGAVVLDANGGDTTQYKWKIPEAIKVRVPGQRQTFQFMNLQEIQSVASQVSLPDKATREQAIVVTSSGVGNAGHNLLSILGQRGFKKLYYFQSAVTWFKYPLPPLKGQWAIPIVTADQIEKNKDLVVLDVREDDEFNQGSVTGALNTVYKIRHAVIHAKQRHADKLGQIPIKLKESFIIDGRLKQRLTDPKKPVSVVVYGVDDHSWNPYLTVIRLRQLGVKNVSWYADGYFDWAQRQKWKNP